MTTRFIVRVLSVAVVSIACAAFAAHAYDAGIESAYSNYSLKMPTASSVIVCHGFGCDRRTEIGLGSGDRANLTSLLAQGRGSAAAERNAVAAAAAWFDRRVGPQAGTTQRIARAGGLSSGGPGQMDCIDTSRNNTSLLLILDQLKLLRFHQVDAPVARGFVTSPHATAVLREIRGGQKWAVDNWTHKYGEKPDVMPLEKWMAAD
jgi:hypothetical protein